MGSCDSIPSPNSFSPQTVFNFEIRLSDDSKVETVSGTICSFFTSGRAHGLLARARSFLIETVIALGIV